MTIRPAEPRPTPRLLHGRLLLVSAAVLWSTTGLFVKSEALRGVPGPTLACLRAFFAAACLLPLLRPRTVRFRPAMVPMACSFAAMNVLFLTAMTLTSAAAAIFLQYTATPWAFVLGLVLLGERWQRGGLIAVGCGLAGIATIVLATPAGQHVWGNLLAAASGLTFAGVIVSLRKLRDESPVLLILVNQSASFLVLLPWLILHPPMLQPGQWLILAAFGVVQMSIPYLLFARGVQHVTAQDAALIVLLEPLLTPLWVWLAGWEQAPLPTSTWIGGGLIVLGLLLRYTVFAERALRPPPAPPSDP